MTIGLKARCSVYSLKNKILTPSEEKINSTKFYIEQMKAKLDAKITIENYSVTKLARGLPYLFRSLSPEI